MTSSPWRFRLRGIVVIGQPTARDAQRQGGDGHVPRLRTDGSTQELRTGS
jgi:hypothetical protein